MILASAGKISVSSPGGRLTFELMDTEHLAVNTAEGLVLLPREAVAGLARLLRTWAEAPRIADDVDRRTGDPPAIAADVEGDWKALSNLPSPTITPHLGGGEP